MDDTLAATTPDVAQVAVPERSTAVERERAHELLASQRVELERLEKELSERLQTLTAAIAQEAELRRAQQPSQDVAPAIAELQQCVDDLSRQLAERQAQLDRTFAELEQLRAAAAHRESDLHEREALVDEVQRQQQQRRLEMANLREQLADTQAQLTAARTRQDELRREAANQREELALAREEGEIQKRRLNRKLRAQREADETRFAAERARLEALAAQRQAELEGQLAALCSETRERSELQVAAGQRHDDLEAQLLAALAQVEHQLELQVSTRAECDGLSARLAEAQAERERLARWQSDAVEREGELEAQLATTRGDMNEARMQLRAMSDSLEQRADELAQARTRAGECDRETAELHEALEDAQTQWERAEARLAELAERELQRLQEALTGGGIGDHAAPQAEADQEELAALRTQSRVWGEKLAAAETQLAQADARLKESEAQLAGAAARLQEYEAQLVEAAAAIEQAQAQGSTTDAASTAITDEQVAQLEAQLMDLEAQCKAAVARAADADAMLSAYKTQSEQQKKGDFQRRFEMAVEELREMKRANAELEAKLLKARNSSNAAAGNDKGALDWESQKRRLLASLEADERDDEDSQEERVSIEATIRITDQIVAQKDQEIAELQRLLQEQSDSVGSMAVGAAAVAELLDRDELIRSEREKLQQAQSEWRERIGRAEIDISLERARIARERAELEERFRSYQNEQSQPEGRSSDLNETQKVPRGWRARLGLKDSDK